MFDRTACVLFASLLSLFATMPQSWAQVPGEPDPEIWVDGPLDTRPGSNPLRPDAAVDSRGRSIFVWDANGGIDSQEIYLRVFERNGTPLSVPVQVNTYTDAVQDYARVAVAADDSFLVIWQSSEPPTPEAGFNRRVVRSQAYDADGQKVGVEQLLSELLPLGTTDISANVAALVGGGYVVCWESHQTVTPGYSETIQVRLVNADGTPNGDQFQADKLFTHIKLDCDVAPLADGGFIVTWFNPEIHARRFAANGTPVADDFQVNTIAINAPRDETAVATSVDGRVLVVWTDSEGTDPVPNQLSEIRGRLFSSTLAPLGPDFRINSLTTGEQDWPKVAGYANDFFVVWQNHASTSADAEPHSIEGRVVTGPDLFAGSQVLINTWTGDSQETPGIGGLGDRVAIAWFSRENAETSQNVIMGLGWGICGIFCNGFE